MRKYYKTREKCERAIGRLFKNGRPQAWDLEPAYNERRKKWYPRVVFTLRTRVNATADALNDIRKKFPFVALKCGTAEAAELRRYVNEALKGAIVACGDIAAMLESEEASEFVPRDLLREVAE